MLNNHGCWGTDKSEEMQSRVLWLCKLFEKPVKRNNFWEAWVGKFIWKYRWGLDWHRTFCAYASLYRPFTRCILKEFLNCFQLQWHFGVIWNIYWKCTCNIQYKGGTETSLFSKENGNAKVMLSLGTPYKHVQKPGPPVGTIYNYFAISSNDGREQECPSWVCYLFTKFSLNLTSL